MNRVSTFSRHLSTAVLTVAALIVALSATACGAGPEDAVKDFYRDLEAGRVEAAAEALSPQILETFGTAKVRLLLERSTREIAEKDGIRTIEVTESEVIGEIATVAVKVTYGDGSAESKSVDLVKRDGDWVMAPGTTDK